MRRRPLLLSALALLALAGCGKKEAAKAPDADAGGGPQIATSLDDYALPADKSDQVTSIDAATGDAAGMPRDGGAAVVTPKPQAKPVAAVPDAAPAEVPPPLVVPPPPPPAPAAPAQ